MLHIRMNFKRNKIISKIVSTFTSVSSILVPIFQYVPCTAIWFGIMSVPLITYLIFFFQYPEILQSDIEFLLANRGFYLILFGFIMFFYSFLYQLKHRKQLIQTGPYKYVRHPQYLAFIIMTLGMTLVIFQTDPVFNFDLHNIDGYTFIFHIWFGEVLAYIILGKIEDFALKAKYGDKFLEYARNTPFMIPFLKLKNNIIKNDIERTL